MGLNNLRLFKNVKITPDYSVVHDMTPETWRQFLTGELWETVPDWNTDSPEQIYSGNVNYYRLPETIRIEGNFDELRQATYGFLHDIKSIRTPSFGTVFFFVEDVRLLKQGSRFDQHQEGTEEQPVVYVDAVDVCELDIKIDVWSSYGGAFQLYDSYVERRHMDRWKNTGTEQDPVWEPIYYPNAAQGVEGAYELESKEIVGLPITREHIDEDPLYVQWVLVSALKDDGSIQCYLGGRAFTKKEDGSVKHTYRIYSGDGSKLLFDYAQTNSGEFYKETEANITANFVQSITVLPPLSSYWNERIHETEINGTWKLTINHGWMRSGTELTWIQFVFPDSSNLNALDEYGDLDVNVVAPDHAYAGDPLDPDTTVYYDEHEPMMYHEPARQRKVVSGFGGELFTLPDIAAFDSKLSWKEMFDLNNVSTFIFAGDNIIRANALGAVGVGESATLPIFNSAWRSYEAINKVSDTIMYNAKQMQTIGTGATSTAIGGIGGMVQGGPLGAIAGIVSGVVGTGLNYYGNDEELRAKRMEIKNSPCTVKSTGSGLGATMVGMMNFWYLTLKMDDQSLEKLRFMYYWYGYHVNRTFKGDIDLHTRTKFDFIKTTGAKVKGDLTAGAAKEIGSIFDRGVTIYHGPEGYALIGSGDMVANDEVDNT